MEFTSVVNSLGSLPLLILIIVIFILLLKEVKKDNERTRTALQQYKQHSDESLKEYKASIDKQIKEHSTSTEKLLSNQNAALQKMEERIRIIEQDYADRAYVQEINSNWRTEIRRLDEKLDRILMGNTK